MFRSLGVVALMMSCACGAAALPAVPGQGGPAWLELSSEHFTMWTDAKPARAHELLRQIEHLRRVIAGIAFPGIPSTIRSTVIALRDDTELSVWSSTGEGRAFAVPVLRPMWQPTIVMSAYSNSRRNDVTAAHELAHLVSFAAVRHQPRWFAEGLATYFESLGLDADARSIEVGGTSWPRDRALPAPTSIATLFAWHGAHPGLEEWRLYVTAWRLFSFLLNEHREEFVRYLELLDRVADAPVAERQAREQAAWRDAFPSLRDVDLDAVFRQWLVYGRHVVTTIQVQPQDDPMAERALPDADVYALYAVAHGSDKEQPQAKREIAAALAADPTNVVAHAVLVLQRKQLPTAEVGRAIAKAHPGDWRAWWLASLALRADRDAAEREADNRKACELALRDAVQGAPLRCPADLKHASSR
jgi:hypothetical protein